EDTVTGIGTIINQLHQRLPHTKLLLLGVLPSDRSAWATETTIAINRTLAPRYAHSNEVASLDIGHNFMKDGKLDRSLFFDPLLPSPSAPLHPTAQAQAMMAAAIEPTLASLLCDPPHSPR